MLYDNTSDQLYAENLYIDEHNEFTTREEIPLDAQINNMLLSQKQTEKTPVMETNPYPKMKMIDGFTSEKFNEIFIIKFLILILFILVFYLLHKNILLKKEMSYLLLKGEKKGE